MRRTGGPQAKRYRGTAPASVSVSMSLNGEVNECSGYVKLCVKGGQAHIEDTQSGGVQFFLMLQTGKRCIVRPLVEHNIGLGPIVGLARDGVCVADDELAERGFHHRGIQVLARSKSTLYSSHVEQAAHSGEMWNVSQRPHGCLEDAVMFCPSPTPQLSGLAIF